MSAALGYILIRHYRYEGYAIVAARPTEATILADLETAMEIGHGDALEAAELLDGGELGWQGEDDLRPITRTIRVVHRPRDAEGHARRDTWQDGPAPEET